jgi:hypothetical protein
MKTILISGGTGLIGTALTELLLSKGYKVIILTRTSRKPRENVSYATWDINKSLIDASAIREADHIIHLAGAGVGDRRWTKKRKEEIISSRVQSSALLIKALLENENKVQSFVSASGIGYYGPDMKGKKPFVEADPYHHDFLGETCRLWEESVKPVTGMGKRLVILRTGIALSNKGGAFPEFVKPMKAGIAAILGGGKQVVSWVHIDDLCRMYLSAIENADMGGVYNAVSPDHITNKELVIRTARARRKPFIPIHVPEFALKILLGEMSIEVLKSATVDAGKIRNSGFKYLYPTFDAALNELASNR